MRIHELASDVVDQIAAGEVVDRPAHLLKELLENALDAEATRIEVDFDSGGKNIKVTDDGAGIEREDLRLAVARHATSKIQNSADLFKLRSFGFRGEALASIAAVSQLTLTSRPKNQTTAATLKVDFGKVSEVRDTAGNLGTTVLAEDLFANVPARRKFLKSESAEATQIKNVFRAVALVRPDVEMRLRSAGKNLAIYPKHKDWLERVRAVLELPKLFESTLEFGGFRAQAVFASPHDVARVSRSIWVMVQDRWVQDRGIQAAVMDAYRGLLMHGEFPIVVMRLWAPTEDVDVNIHPTKSAVKFLDPSAAFRVAQRVLRQGLEKAPWLPEATSYENETQRPPALPEHGTRVAAPSSSYQLDMSTMMDQRASQELSRTQYSRPVIAPDNDRPERPLQGWRGALEQAAQGHANRPTAETSTRKLYWSQLQVLAQADLTYIIAQSDNSLVLIDQHAAHERVAYERLIAGFKNNQVGVQAYLLPLTVTLEPDALEALLLNRPEIAKMGFDIDQIGPESLGVRAAPALLRESAVTTGLEKLAQECLRAGGGFALERVISDVFATMACHSVVRAGHALSHEQMVQLLQQMDEFPLSSFCPHGRPVSIQFEFSRLERDFGRIT